MNAGRWAKWYDVDAAQAPYGGEPSYALAAEWLSGLAVEDWGCGLGWFRRHHDGPYVGVDGTASPWADVVADLTVYRSETDGLLLRHVIEHNDEWRAVLANACASFRRRMCLVVFTPPADETHQVAWVDELGVPDIAIAQADIEAVLAAAGCEWRLEVIEQSPSGYHIERVWLAWKS